MHIVCVRGQCTSADACKRGANEMAVEVVRALEKQPTPDRKYSTTVCLHGLKLLLLEITS